MVVDLTAGVIMAGKVEGDHPVVKEEASAEGGGRLLYRVGEHTMLFTPPDRLLFTMGVELTLADVEMILKVIFAIGDEHPQLVVVSDMGKLIRVGMRAREALVRVERPYPFRALASVGQSFAARMIGKTIITAARIVASNQFPFPVEFFESIEAAERWLNSLSDSPTDRR